MNVCNPTAKKQYTYLKIMSEIFVQQTLVFAFWKIWFSISTLFLDVGTVDDCTASSLLIKILTEDEKIIIFNKCKCINIFYE